MVPHITAMNELHTRSVTSSQTINAIITYIEDCLGETNCELGFLSLEFQFVTYILL